MTTTATRYDGPPLIVPAAAYIGCFVVAIGLGSAAGIFGTPSTAAADVVANVAGHHGIAGAVSILQLVATLALGVWTAAVTSAIRSRGIDVAALQIARLGGYGASILLALSAVFGWATGELAVDGVAEAAKATSLLAFAAGGPAHVVFLGVLLAGVSVPGLLGGLLPRWIGVLGLVLAAIAAVAVLSLAITPLQFLLPVVRFPSIVWLLAVAIALPLKGTRNV